MTFVVTVLLNSCAMTTLVKASLFAVANCSKLLHRNPKRTGHSLVKLVVYPNIQ